MTILNRLTANDWRAQTLSLVVAMLVCFTARFALADSVRSFERAMIIPVEGEINDITTGSINRRLDRVRVENVPLVIFRMDTPGGAVGPTLKICNAIKQIRDQGVKVYAWIDDNAYSAGAIIALATDGIIMAPTATLGDCQPLVVTEIGPSAVPAELEPKIVSPVLEEMRASARRNGYSVDLVESMVRPNLQVFWVVDSRTDQRRFVDARQRDELFGWAEAQSGPAGSAPAGASSGRPTGAEPLPDSASKTSWRYVRYDPQLGQVRQPIVAAQELLTMKADRAHAYGFSLGVVASESDLRNFFGIRGVIEHADLTWFEAIAGWLASPIVRSLLFMMIVMGLYAEFHAPGVGLPGAVALGALVLFLGAPYLAGFTVSWEIAAIVLGMVLLALELFVIPGFGVAGIAGLLLVGIGMLSSFVPPEPFERHWFDPPQMPITYRYIRQGLFAMTGGMVGSVVGMILLARYLPRAPIVKQIIGRNPTHDEVMIDDPYHGIAKLGDIGRTETLLRPAGKARFGVMLVDVVSEGEYVTSGQQVEVIERRGNRIVVRRV